MQARYAQHGELGESFYRTPTVVLQDNVEFESKSDEYATKVLGFVQTETVKGTRTERQLRLARVQITDGDITAHYLSGGPYDAGTVMASAGGRGVLFNGGALQQEWLGLIGKDFYLGAMRQHPFAPGTYDLAVHVAQAANLAMQAEQEHEDDFEHAFQSSYGAVEFFINRNTGRTYTFGSDQATSRYDPNALQGQEASYKRVALQDLVQDLRFQRPELLPPDIGVVTSPAQIISALEMHWGRCLGGLRGLSILRDYNASHTARSEVYIDAPPVSNQQQNTGGWQNNPLQQSSGPNWTVSPLQSRGTQQPRTPLVTPGRMRLVVAGPPSLLGDTPTLISYSNPYFKESYRMALSKQTRGVRDYRW